LGGGVKREATEITHQARVGGPNEFASQFDMLRPATQREGNLRKKSPSIKAGAKQCRVGKKKVYISPRVSRECKQAKRGPLVGTIVDGREQYDNRLTDEE